MDSQFVGRKDQILFTPGPLATSHTVKQAMLRDLGSRDYELVELVRDIRRRLVVLGQVREPEYTAVLMQGSGTFGVEAIVSSTVPRHGKLLVLVNGSYSRRMVQMARILNIDVAEMVFPDDRPVEPGAVEVALTGDPTITNVAVAHCETTSGILNPIQEIGDAVMRHGAVYAVDAMSSFGAVPVDLAAAHVDFLVSSANKCIEGVPGFSFVLARTDRLLSTAGYARSFSLDLYAQYRGLEETGQFRFTPPTHTLLAFHQALLELESEGGVAGRAARYRRNYQVVRDGMRRLGFREFLAPELQSYINTGFCYPADPNFAFEEFYQRLHDLGYVIYRGQPGAASYFRIGHIGRIFESDSRELLQAIREVLVAMEVDLPVRYE